MIIRNRGSFTPDLGARCTVSTIALDLFQGLKIPTEIACGPQHIDNLCDFCTTLWDPRIRERQRLTHIELTLQG